MTEHNSKPFQLIHLADDESGVALDALLKKRHPNWTWGQAREAILKRRVQINGNLCLDQARKLTPKDVVKLWDHSLAKPVQPDTIKIVYVDDFIVVVEKPPGITSTRHFEERNLKEKRKQLQPTLEELLPLALEHHFMSYRNKGGANPKPKTPGRPKIESPREREHRLKRFAVVAVHRLDRDTSGLMLFARTQSIAQALGQSFRKHEVTRKYHAVVHGHPEPRTIESTLVRDRGDGKRGTIPPDRSDDPTSQQAITHVRPIETIGPYALIECQLETGRTHQIRIHLSESGHMLCGDTLYDRALDGTRTKDESNAPRQALHSAILEFKHPISGDALSFRMSWPADLHRWLASLKTQYGNNRSY